MNIETSKATKIILSDLRGYKLDPVTIFLEDLEPRKGKITIECYGESWSSYWGGMGDRTIAEFFVSCDDHYLAKNLSDIRSNVPDCEALDSWLKNTIIKSRRENDIEPDKARELWDDVELFCSNDKDWLHGLENQRLCSEIIGDNWWYSLPTKLNPEYEYLTRVINAVRDALRLITQKNAA